MQYRVARDGKEIGEHDKEGVKSGLQQGTIRRTDLIWGEGMGSWITVNEWLIAQAPALVGSGVSGNALPPSGIPPVSGLSISALVVGIISLISCSFFSVASLAAIVCGHLALSRIRSSHGALGGRGLALAGTIMGYLSLAVFVLLIVLSLTIPTMERINERTKMTIDLVNARQLVTEVKQYAEKNDGMLPQSLDDLVSSGMLTQDKLDTLQGGTAGEDSFDYLGMGFSNTAPTHTVILIGRRVYGKNGTLVATLDGTVDFRSSTPVP